MSEMMIAPPIEIKGGFDGVECGETYFKAIGELMELIAFLRSEGEPVSPQEAERARMRFGGRADEIIERFNKRREKFRLAADIISLFAREINHVQQEEE